MSGSVASEGGMGGLHPITDLPIVGRENELETLRQGLRKAKAGSGSVWTVVGPGGIGKTRVLRTLEKDAQQLGVHVRWGFCLKEALSPFLPFEQIFRSGAGAGAPEPTDEGTGVAGATLLYEEERPRRSLARATALGATHPLLVIGRDRPASLRQKYPDLPATSEVLWLTRTEGPECISPGSIDGLGERIDTFLTAHPGGVVALTGLEYLISQNGFLPVLRLVQMLRDVGEASQGTLLLAVHAATLEARELSLLEAEGEVLREAAPAAAPTAAPAAEPPALRLLRYLESLREEARAKPQLLLLDDLQWADPQSRTAFQFLARNARDLPVMMVGALRGDEVGEAEAPGDDPLSEVLDHMDQEGILRPIRLGGLRASDAGQLVQELLGAPLELGRSDQAFLDILERTGGNPYFLLESLQHLLEQGFLRRDGARSILSLPTSPGGKEGGAVVIPPTIRRLVSRRLEALAPEDRRFLEVAAVAGSEFDVPPVAAVLGASLQDTEEVARRMVRRLRLLQPGAKDGAYEFAHPLVWEVLREMVDPANERATSLQLARWWERERPEDAETLARLFHTAQERTPGLVWIGKALEKAVAAKAPGVVLRYLSWRRELLTDSSADLATRAEVEIPVVVRLYREGAGEAARTLAEELAKLPLEPPLRWEAALAHIQVNLETGGDRMATELERLQRELASGRAAVPPDLLGRTRHTEAVLDIQQGRYPDGAVAAAKVRALPVDRLEKDTVVGGLLAEVFCLQGEGRMPEALERMDEAKEMLAQCKYPETGIRLYNVEGALRFAVGDLKGAVAPIDEAVRRAHDAGHVTLEVLYLGNGANVAWMLGDLPRALRLCDDGIALARKFSYDKGVHNIRRVRCSLLADLGRFDEAERDLQETLEWLQRSGHTLHAAEAQKSMAELHGRRGDVKRAVEEYNAVEEIYKKFRDRQMVELYLDRSRHRAHLGDLKGAYEDLKRAEADPMEMRSPAYRARLAMTTSDVEEAAGEKAKAREARQKGLELLRKLGASSYRGVSLADLEKSLEALA